MPIRHHLDLLECAVIGAHYPENGVILYMNNIHQKWCNVGGLNVTKKSLISPKPAGLLLLLIGYLYLSGLLSIIFLGLRTTYFPFETGFWLKAIILLTGVWAILAATYLWKRDPYAVPIVKGLFFAILAWNVFDLLLCSTVICGVNDVVKSVLPTIWLIYLYTSKRVKDTYK